MSYSPMGAPSVYAVSEKTKMSKLSDGREADNAYYNSVSERRLSPSLNLPLNFELCIMSGNRSQKKGALIIALKMTN